MMDRRTVVFLFVLILLVVINPVAGEAHEFEKDLVLEAHLSGDPPRCAEGLPDCNEVDESCKGTCERIQRQCHRDVHANAARARRTFDNEGGFSLVSFENCSLAFASASLPSAPTWTAALEETWRIILRKLTKRACSFAEQQVDRLDDKLQDATTFQVDMPYGVSAQIQPGTFGALEGAGPGGIGDRTEDQRTQTFGGGAAPEQEPIISVDSEEMSDYIADAVSNRARQWYEEESGATEFFDELDELNNQIDEAEQQLENELSEDAAIPDRSPDNYDDY